MTSRSLAGLLFVLCACGAGTGSPDPMMMMMQNGSPEVLSLTSGKLVLAPGETAIINATLRPGSGGSTIKSGELLKGAQSIGVFNGHGDGTWSTGATWSALVDAMMSEGADNSAAVTLTAKFFDSEARVATSTLQLKLRCTSDRESLCSGQCVNATAAPNCGTCGATCGAMTTGPDGIAVPTECRAAPSGGRASCGAVVGTRQATSCATACGAARAYGRPMVCQATCYMPHEGTTVWTNTWNEGNVAGRSAWNDSFDPTLYLREPLVTCDQAPRTISHLTFVGSACCCRAQP
jgi:hypothetical protein